MKNILQFLEAVPFLVGLWIWPGCGMRRPPKPTVSALVGRYGGVFEYGRAYLTLNPDGTYREMIRWKKGRVSRARGRWTVTSSDSDRDWHLKLNNALNTIPLWFPADPPMAERGAGTPPIVITGDEVSFSLSVDEPVCLRRMRGHWDEPQ